MKLVENKIIYWEFIRDLRNDTNVKKGFISQKYISPEEHANHMHSFNHCYYICLGSDTDEGNLPLGYCGVIDEDIRVATSPEHQGKGVGVFMIRELASRHPNAFAKVKIENKASLSLFQKCGFKKKYYILERK
jgi:GNAT superfamily N-acetyltransferase